MKSCGQVIIDLAVIQSNWLIMRDRLRAGAQAGAVVKDNAYGLGAIPVAKALYDVGCRTFFFITPEEALSVLPHIPNDIHVVILGGFRLENERLFSDSRLIPILHSFESLQRWLSFVDGDNQRSAVLKFDTGMSRLGFDLSDLSALIRDYSHLPVFALMSHLACADDKLHALNKLQLQAFRDMAETLKPIYPNALCSLSNSAGIFLGEDWHFDLARPGAGLYGISPNQDDLDVLKPAVQLRLPVLQCKTFSKPIQIGYGATAECNVGARLIVVAGGYADGLNRVMGNEPEAICNGHRIKAVGRMSMDSIIFDISHLPEADIPAVGDYIDVMNLSDLSVNYWMQKTQSLGYEIFTALGSRLERIYKTAGD